jgi:M6 family metalloprotease-like protein
MPLPLHRRQVTLVQPDQTTITSQMLGNQTQYQLESKDGYPVVKDPVTGYYQYGVLAPDEQSLIPSGVLVGSPNTRHLNLLKASALRELNPQALIQHRHLLKKDGPTRWQIRHATEKMFAQSGQQPAQSIRPEFTTDEGVQHIIGLCLLVEFPGDNHRIDPLEAANFLNQSGHSGHGSVLDYFYDVSGGQLHYETLIPGAVYTAKYARDYYTDPNIEFGVRAEELVREAIDDLSNGPDAEIFRALTHDQDGYVLATNLLYAGPEDSDGLYPHSTHLEEAKWVTNDSCIYDYQMTSYGQQPSLGIYCHENGHMLFGFNDLYDPGWDGIQSFGVGGYCLMGYGCMADENNPTHPNMYLKYRAGWVNPVELLNGHSYRLPADGTSCFIHRRNEHEYFLLEHRHSSGRDATLPGSGLLIWHVDEWGSNEHQQMTSEHHYECSLVQADGAYDLELGQGIFYGDANDVFHPQGVDQFGYQQYPSASWWDGTDSGLRLYDINIVNDEIIFNAEIL